MSGGDIIYSPIKRRGIYIPDWGKIPLYINIISPDLLNHDTTVGFSGVPEIGMHFVIPHVCDDAKLKKEITSALKWCLNTIPSLSIDNQRLKSNFFKCCYDYDMRSRFLAVHCNTIEGWDFTESFVCGGWFFDLQQQPRLMVDSQGNIDPALIELVEKI